MMLLPKNRNTLAILVNYNSAGLALGAVQSVLNAEVSGALRMAVVDNSGRQGEAEHLRASLPPSVELVINATNVGFGRACNQIFEKDQSDSVLLINPDARLLPGCLHGLQETLYSNRNVGAAGPQLFWDESFQYYFPPPCSPTLLKFRSLFSGRKGLGIGEILDILWRRYAIQIWQSKKPLRVRNLSGGLVLLKRQAVRDAGGLFDPRFFLYFEDTDLFVRLRKNGYRLLLDPEARAVHYFGQCGKNEQNRKRAFMMESMTLFSDKHPNMWNTHFFRSIIQKFPSNGKIPVSLKTRFSAPFSLRIPDRLRKKWVFEWSPNPTFMPAAVRFDSGPIMEFSSKHWNMLAPGRYYGRMGSAKWYDRQFEHITWEVQ